MILFPPKLGVNGTILPFWSVFEACAAGNEKDGSGSGLGIGKAGRTARTNPKTYG
jgi:hypothetical protein